MFAEQKFQGFFVQTPWYLDKIRKMQEASESSYKRGNASWKRYTGLSAW